ncbi:MAG: glycosyl transferase [Candidatus Symbiothrix sp.]|jgi:glycosyltransferase involved in cell wall biosynthesis|nr:glycosyl transferase [Candidatus Symbiothrix sp.]
MSKKKEIIPDFIFETSWEVCNKVGGIYTVLSTRAATLQALLKDKIVFIGPDLKPDNPDFLEDKALWSDWRRQVWDNLGLPVRVGRWNVPGQPLVVLVDFQPLFPKKNAIQFGLWEKYGIDSTVGYGDYDESCVFAYATGMVMENLYHHIVRTGCTGAPLRSPSSQSPSPSSPSPNVIAHFNEWTLGVGLLYVQSHVPELATVFTTHATSIGRSICGNGKPLYGELAHYNGNQMAQELNVVAKHTLEQKAAQYADCFTTVSEITGDECAQLLEKRPDVITPNGFESGFVPKGRSYASKRTAARNTLIKVAERLTGTSISDDAFLIATSGRYEYRNKGLDVFIESLNRVRQELGDRDEGDCKGAPVRPVRTIVAYILVPAWMKGARADLQAQLQQRKANKEPLYEPFYTHDLVQPGTDPVSDYLYYLDFTNWHDEKVKIVFVPSYLHGDDGIFNLPYYDLLIGMDLTIFPSYYEPWGYTPLESIAFHVPTITTNLAGFGIWAKHSGKGKVKRLAVEIVERTDDNYFEVAEAIKNTVLKQVNENEQQVSERREAALALSEQASWSHFIQYYLEAYSIASKKKHP